jgi:hypothetical protein
MRRREPGRRRPHPRALALVGGAALERCRACYAAAAVAWLAIDPVNGWTRDSHDTCHQIVDRIRPYFYTARMRARLKKITVNLPAHVLENATKLTGKGITPTILEGLQELQRRSQRSALRALKGKVRFALDLEETRR